MLERAGFAGLCGAVSLMVAATPAAARERDPGLEAARGPADQLVLEGSGGYGGGLFTAIQGHDPKVAHGAAFHVGLGWAWTVKRTQSLGAELFADGSFDASSIVGPGSTGKVAPRYGVAAALWGDLAHLRVGGAWATSRYEGGKYGGPSLVFAAGWHVTLMPTLKTWKRPMFTFELVPSFDFLKAGDETLNRWTLAAMAGIAAY